MTPALGAAYHVVKGVIMSFAIYCCPGFHFHVCFMGSESYLALPATVPENFILGVLSLNTSHKNYTGKQYSSRPMDHLNAVGTVLLSAKNQFVF